MESKIFLIVLVAVVTPIIGFFEKYIFGDWEYLTFLILLIVGDTLLGVYLHWRNKSISADAWWKIGDKLITYMSLVIAIHILSHFTIDGVEVRALQWTKYLGYSGMIVKEAISIVTNVGKINSKLVPNALLKRLKDFDNKGNDTN